MIFVEACRNCKFDKVVLPDSVEIIDKYAFSRSWNLKEVEGGKNVERIRDYAFFGCMNLKHLLFMLSSEVSEAPHSAIPP